MSIELDKLIEFSESEFYDPVKKPITIKNIKEKTYFGSLVDYHLNIGI